jgi:hypothetical protein
LDFFCHILCVDNRVSETPHAQLVLIWSGIYSSFAGKQVAHGGWELRGGWRVPHSGNLWPLMGAAGCPHRACHEPAPPTNAQPWQPSNPWNQPASVRVSLWKGQVPGPAGVPWNSGSGNQKLRPESNFGRLEEWHPTCLKQLVERKHAFVWSRCV